MRSGGSLVRIGIDFDGTIADTTDTKMRYARDVLGEIVTPLETWSPDGPARLGIERFREMARAAHREHTLMTRPLAGSLEAVARLATQHDLYVVTARDDEEIEWATRWLSERSLPFRDVVYTRRASKLEACRGLRLDVLIDDMPRVLEDVATAGIGAVLIETPYNLALPRHPLVEAVSHWDEFVTWCEGAAIRANTEGGWATPSATLVRGEASP